MKVVGISGKAYHGKDTCATIMQEIAVERYSGLLGTWAMADALKATVFGEANGDFTFEDVWERKPPEVRRMLQLRGTEQGRMKYGVNVWTLQSEAYLRVIAKRLPFVDGLIFTDIRFPNEVDFILNCGSVLPARKQGLALYIESDRPTLIGEAASHDSETALDHMDKNTEFSGIITNNRDTTLENLKLQLLPYVHQLFK